MSLRTFSTTFLIAAATCALGVSGCDDHGGIGREPDVYFGCSSDEVWRVFDDEERAGRVRLDAAQAPQLHAPLSDGATLSAAARPTLSWQPTPSVAGNATGNATCAQCPSCGGLGTSHAPPVSGDAYDLQLSENGAVVYRALTTMQTLDLDAATWTSWKGRTLSLRIVRVSLKANEVQDGPFQGPQQLRFTVGP